MIKKLVEDLRNAEILLIEIEKKLDEFTDPQSEEGEDISPNELMILKNMHKELDTIIVCIDTKFDKISLGHTKRKAD